LGIILSYFKLATNLDLGGMRLPRYFLVVRIALDSVHVHGSSFDRMAHDGRGRKVGGHDL